MVRTGAFPLQVKNTFISVDDHSLNEEEEDSFFETARILTERQATEPLPRRQLSTGGPQQRAVTKEPVEPEQEPRRDLEDDGDELELNPFERLVTGLEAVNYWDRLVTGDCFEASSSPLGNVGPAAAPTTVQEAADYVGLQPCMPYQYQQNWWWNQSLNSNMTGLDGAMLPSTNDYKAPPAEWSETYTVMMRNLPNKYTQAMLLEEIDASGFVGCYDFIYLPIDIESHANKGYAFINFVEPTLAWKFKVFFEGAQMRHFNSGKTVTVTPAALQGFEANHAHYANARVSRGAPDARPLFLRQVDPYQPGVAAKAAPRRRRGGRRSLIDQAAHQLAASKQQTPTQVPTQQQSPHQPQQQQQQQPQQLRQLQQLEYKSQAFAAADASTASGSERDAASSADGVPGPMAASSFAGSYGGGGSCPQGPAGYTAPYESGHSQVSYCPFCGGKVGLGFKFCQFCGSSLAFDN